LLELLVIEQPAVVDDAGHIVALAGVVKHVVRVNREVRGVPYVAEVDCDDDLLADVRSRTKLSRCITNRECDERAGSPVHGRVERIDPWVGVEPMYEQ
jgi:hypothetical protein